MEQQPLTLLQTQKNNNNNNWSIMLWECWALIVIKNVKNNNNNKITGEITGW